MRQKNNDMKEAGELIPNNDTEEIQYFQIPPHIATIPDGHLAQIGYQEGEWLWCKTVGGHLEIGRVRETIIY